MEDLMMKKKEYGVWVETQINSGGQFEIEYLMIFDDKKEAIEYYQEHRITIEEQKEDNFRTVMFIEDTNIMEKYIDVPARETEEE
jgi:hypothetical protein